jgi:superfamily II DNA/RNA helicase
MKKIDMACFYNVTNDVSLQALILDEVDVLLGEQGAFQEELLPLLSHAGEDTRVVFVTATLPETVFLKLKSHFPGIAPALGPNLHKIGTGASLQLSLFLMHTKKVKQELCTSSMSAFKEAAWDEGERRSLVCGVFVV